MTDHEKSGLAFIQELETRHEDVLTQLEDLNRRIEMALEYYAESRKPKSEQIKPPVEGVVEATVEANPNTSDVRPEASMASMEANLHSTAEANCPAGEDAASSQAGPAEAAVPEADSSEIDASLPATSLPEGSVAPSDVTTDADAETTELQPLELEPQSEGSEPIAVHLPEEQIEQTTLQASEIEDAITDQAEQSAAIASGTDSVLAEAENPAIADSDITDSELSDYETAETGSDVLLDEEAANQEENKADSAPEPNRDTELSPECDLREEDELACQATVTDSEEFDEATEIVTEANPVEAASQIVEANSEEAAAETPAASVDEDIADASLEAPITETTAEPFAEVESAAGEEAEEVEPTPDAKLA